MKNTFQSKDKFSLIFRKKNSFILSKILFLKIIKKLKNIMLFVDYIKFGSQSSVAIYFIFEYFFLQFHHIEFD
jgi:hypothetical protein